jgi:hypothetical protein
MSSSNTKIDYRSRGPILIYCTQADLEELFQSEVIAVDGTFDIKPIPYSRNRGAQVLTLNVFFGHGDSNLHGAYWSWRRW